MSFGLYTTEGDGLLRHKGQVILLNGSTSAGKSSVAKVLQATLPTAHLNIGIDDFFKMLPGRLHGNAEGVWFEEQADASMPLRLGPSGQALARAFHRAVRTLVDQGLCVIVDDVIFEPWLLDDWLNVLESVDVLFVGLFCPLPELERRELARGDRLVGQARAQFNTVHAHECYDLTIDTSLQSPEAAAMTIAAALIAQGSRLAFSTLQARRKTAAFDAVVALGRMRKGWSAGTSSLWTPETPARGQCDVTALVLHTVHGGDLLQTQVPTVAQPHYYNRINGHRIDLTVEQFAAPLAYSDAHEDAEAVMATLLPGQFETLFAAYLDAAAAEAPAPVLQTDRLCFYPFRGADLPLLYRLHEDPRVQTGYSPTAEPWSRLKTAKKLAGFIAEHRDFGHGKWKLCLADGTFIGRAGWASWGPQQELEIGYALLPEFWRKGYAVEAAHALIDWAFSSKPIGHVIGFAYSQNLASRRVLERVGMKYVDDRYVDDGMCAFYRVERDAPVD